MKFLLIKSLWALLDNFFFIIQINVFSSANLVVSYNSKNHKTWLSVNFMIIYNNQQIWYTCILWLSYNKYVCIILECKIYCTKRTLSYQICWEHIKLWLDASCSINNESRLGFLEKISKSSLVSLSWSVKILVKFQTWV